MSLTNGRYRRVLTVHARDIRLLSDQNAAVVEISGGVNGKKEHSDGMAADLSSDKEFGRRRVGPC